MTTVDDNEAYEGDDGDYQYTNNFIDTPWDDRSKKSKIGIISLLVSIFALIVICVCHNFMMHYATGSFPTYKVENTCPLINLNDIGYYNFVAKVYSLSSKELLCVGAVLSDNAVLADEICARDGPVILVVGQSKDPRCKKGHAVDEIIEVDHEGMLSQKLIIIKSKGDFTECRSTIQIGSELEWKTPAHIIGRPLTHSGRALITKQPVAVFGRGNCSIPGTLSQKLDKNMIICVTNFGRCQVHAGDLLTQRGRLLGLASTGVHRSGSTAAYFADLNSVRGKLAPFVDSSK
ncbi:uncharacterized protein LOC134754113 [Cydia strobilella]|uniref:uncharacterized protein LOC134754113 n=1 Tax=Cydia strobilella TaxID=1100964 RepID=UPI0030067B4A